MNKKEKTNPLKKVTEKYTHAIAITLLYSVEKEMVNFIAKAAVMDPEIIYFLLPRQKKDDFGIILPINVKVINSINFYQMMACVDFHSTVYSACAIEAPSLGVQNILINIGGTAKFYFENILTDDNVTKYVETPEEFVYVIQNMKKINYYQDPYAENNS